MHKKLNLKQMYLQPWTSRFDSTWPLLAFEPYGDFWRRLELKEPTLHGNTDVARRLLEHSCFGTTFLAERNAAAESRERTRVTRTRVEILSVCVCGCVGVYAPLGLLPRSAVVEGLSEVSTERSQWNKPLARTPYGHYACSSIGDMHCRCAALRWNI